MDKQRAAAMTSPPGTDARLRRVVIEDVEPQVDCGRFPIKRVVGEAVTVAADIHADGHDAVAAVVQYRRAGASAGTRSPWRRSTTTAGRGTFVVDALGRYQYTVEGWIDRFAGWRHQLAKKIGAGQDVASELLEGAALVLDAGERIADGETGSADWPSQRVLGAADEEMGARLAAALSEDPASVMAAHPDRSRATRFDRVLGVVVERERARFGAWYEMFPRSAGPDPSRSATFDEAAALLPYVASMGFDVLYLPPDASRSGGASARAATIR